MANLSQSSISYFSPIPDYENQLVEFETFIGKLSDDNTVLDECRLLWKSVNQFIIRAARLQKKWTGTKKATGINPIGMIRKDLNHLMYKLNLGVSRQVSATEWGVSSTESILDILPNELPYLSVTNYWGYLSEIGKLLEELILRSKHSTIMKILREIKEHRDMTVIGQFSSNEMVRYFKYLAGIKSPLYRQAIVELIGIYKSLCGIYEKDMTLAYYLIKEKENRFGFSYKELREMSVEPRSKGEFIHYVGDNIALFKQPYRRALRNADAHTDIETDGQRRIVIVSGGKNKPNEQYPYDEVLKIAREMSALVAAFRLLVVVQANNDWKSLHNVLTPK